MHVYSTRLLSFTRKKKWGKLRARLSKVGKEVLIEALKEALIEAYRRKIDGERVRGATAF